jgi:thiamine transporter
MSTPLTPPHASVATTRARLNAHPERWGVITIAEIGVAIALSAALGYLSSLLALKMPQGGSFGLEMLPILFVAVRRGVVPAVVAGALYGFVQLTGVSGPAYIYHPLQVALDYPLAFAALGLAGFVPVARRVPLGSGWLQVTGAVAVGTAGRFVFHFLSGLIYFGSYAPQWEASWLYSITYNLLYLVPSAIAAAILLLPILRAYDAAAPAALVER